MFRILTVTGNSLSPAYQEGDYVVIVTFPFLFGSIKRGDVIAFQHESYGMMIKQVDYISRDRDEIFVTGTHERSLDSRRFGPISKRALTGKMLWHIRKPKRKT